MVTKVIINYLVIDNTKIIDSFESDDLCTKNTIIKVFFVTYLVSISKWRWRTLPMRTMRPVGYLPSSVGVQSGDGCRGNLFIFG